MAQTIARAGIPPQTKRRRKSPKGDLRNGTGKKTEKGLERPARQTGTKEKRGVILIKVCVESPSTARIGKHGSSRKKWVIL